MTELTPQQHKVNLLGLDRKAMEAFCVSLGEKSYRATQIIKWIHFQGTQDIQAMSNLSKSLREKLMTESEISVPEVTYENTSADGTHKWVLRLADGNCIETVFIPEKTRGTLCVSSQVG